MARLRSLATARDTAAIRAMVTLSRLIADLTGERLCQRGRELVIRCPFHADSNPSLRVNDKKNHGVWCCDPCGKGGDVFTFVMEHQGLGFAAAVDFLADRYNPPVPAGSRSRAW